MSQPDVEDELRGILSWGALHQVWFVRDYFTLVFQDYQRIVVTNLAEIVGVTGRAIAQSDPGFCDHLVGCIESNVGNLQYIKGRHLQLTFANGVMLRLLLDGSHARGPEAFELQQAGDLSFYIEFN
jgi:hypothetical protein